MESLTTACRTFVSVGSNMGDKLDNCLGGIAALAKVSHTFLEAVSRFYRTSPVDYTDQDWFVNAVAEIRTSLSPDALLGHLQDIQTRMGRKNHGIRFGPRVLDLDILLMGDLTIRSLHLEIPHPRMHKRTFVLKPICDIDPSVVHPVLGCSMADLLKAFENTPEGAEQKIAVLRDAPAITEGR
ncbi:2-amino-4-hydroxy-6-hydroxymethyldihydropteridine diphosphokinase [Desulfosarcina sp. OttesenSCG-928-A07]|nr:2-amino-4-hydroxy-6-hydroxymethyldihydropteridine diphosphokinase [Desulfosarcina sp. OttesenSCG-928-G17]MDL2328955.1 2-amino-4-hydroxy-6-hydroxymethyldihydropteridine diphosphokinase [Desulfosarcina sp. OttesenSCG-928-A07]